MKIANVNETSKEIMNCDFWRKHYAQYKESGLSKAAYSRQHDLIAPRFIYWSRKFEEETQIKPIKPSSFVEVKVQSEAHKQPVGLCVLELGSSRRLVIHDIAVMKILLNSLGVCANVLGI
jgi:transposase-like protein